MRCLSFAPSSASGAELLRLAAALMFAESVEALVSGRSELLLASTTSVTVATVLDASGAYGGGDAGGGHRGGGGGKQGEGTAGGA